MNDEYYMALAIEEAKKAVGNGETPIGAVLVHKDEVIASAHNMRETGKNALSHAEMLCINEACRKLGGWRLPECTLYITLQPCIMCSGAIINARIDRVVYGAKDGRSEKSEKLLDLFAFPYEYQPAVEGGVLERECSKLISEFFRELRYRTDETEK